MSTLLMLPAVDAHPRPCRDTRGLLAEEQGSGLSGGPAEGRGDHRCDARGRRGRAWRESKLWS